MSKTYAFPIYTEVGQNIMNAAFTYWRNMHKTSIFANSRDLRFDDKNYPEGELTIYASSYISNINTLFKKAIKEMLDLGFFWKQNSDGKLEEYSIPLELRNDRKCQLEVLYKIRIGIGSWARDYKDTRKTVKFKITDAWFLYDYLDKNFPSGSGLNKLLTIYDKQQYERVIGQPNDPMKVERYKLFNQEVEAITAKYKGLISQDSIATENKIRDLRQKHTDFENKQNRLQEEEIQKLKKQFMI